MKIRPLLGIAAFVLATACTTKPPACADDSAGETPAANESIDNRPALPPGDDMLDIKPFGNEADSVPIGELTVENGPDRIAIYGSLQITKDKAGLQLAQDLKELINATVAVLQAEKNLPDHVQLTPVKRVDNPFK